MSTLAIAGVAGACVLASGTVPVSVALAKGYKLGFTLTPPAAKNDTTSQMAGPSNHEADGSALHQGRASLSMPFLKTARTCPAFYGGGQETRPRGCMRAGKRLRVPPFPWSLSVPATPPAGLKCSPALPSQVRRRAAHPARLGDGKPRQTANVHDRVAVSKKQVAA